MKMSNKLWDRYYRTRGRKPFQSHCQPQFVAINCFVGVEANLEVVILTYSILSDDTIWTVFGHHYWNYIYIYIYICFTFSHFFVTWFRFSGSRMAIFVPECVFPPWFIKTTWHSTVWSPRVFQDDPCSSCSDLMPLYLLVPKLCAVVLTLRWRCREIDPRSKYHNKGRGAQCTPVLGDCGGSVV